MKNWILCRYKNFGKLILSSKAKAKSAQRLRDEILQSSASKAHLEAPDQFYCREFQDKGCSQSG